MDVQLILIDSQLISIDFNWFSIYFNSFSKESHKVSMDFKWYQWILMDSYRNVLDVQSMLIAFQLILIGVWIDSNGFYWTLMEFQLIWIDFQRILIDFERSEIDVQWFLVDAQWILINVNRISWFSKAFDRLSIDFSSCSTHLNRLLLIFNWFG